MSLGLLPPAAPGPQPSSGQDQQLAFETLWLTVLNRVEKLRAPALHFLKLTAARVNQDPPNQGHSPVHCGQDSRGCGEAGARGRGPGQRVASTHGLQLVGGAVWLPVWSLEAAGAFLPWLGAQGAGCCRRGAGRALRVPGQALAALAATASQESSRSCAGGTPSAARSNFPRPLFSPQGLISLHLLPKDFLPTRLCLKMFFS